MADDEREYDLVLLGATGFTGALAAAHLARRTMGRPWAIAGRDLERLGVLREQLGQLGTTPGIVLADVDDDRSLRELASSTRVLASTVGPFAQLGEPVVHACVAARTEYADITGEPVFVDRVRRDLDQRAVDAGIRIVTCCGFDSVPHDLAVHHAVSVLPDDEPIDARGFVRLDARFSGGTMRSALQAVTGRATGPRVPRRGDDDRRIGRGDVSRGYVRGHGMVVPLPTVDPDVVLRSAKLLPTYGPAFTYAHHLVLDAPALGNARVLAGVGAAAVVARLPGGQRVADRLLPDPGTGPAPGRRARSSFSVTVDAEAAGGARSRAVVAGGDPGYDETAVMLGETVLGLLDDEVPHVPGVITPAVALGDALRARLVAQGQRHEVELLDPA